MIERVHAHILSELQTNTRTDTIFALTAIILNLVTLGINSGIASGRGDSTMTSIMFTVAGLWIVVNFVPVVRLISVRQT